MWRILKFLVTGSWHRHEWTLFEQAALTDPERGHQVGKMYILRCLYCGEMKKFET